MRNDKTLTDAVTSTEEGMRLWQHERVIFEITERLCELMEERKVSRAVLATRLGTTRGYITQLLDGTRNMTLNKISDVFLALGRQFHGDDGPICTANVLGPTTIKLLDFTLEVEEAEEPDFQMEVVPFRRAAM